MAEDYLSQKIELVLGGDVRIPADCRDPLFEYRDGEPYFVVMMFGDCRVRKRINPDGPFSLVVTDEGYALEKEGKPFIDHVELKKMYCHSPDLAVITLGKEDGVLSATDVMNIISDFETKMVLKGVTLHAGKGCSKEHYLEVLKAVRWWYPKLDIGVASNDFTKEDMKAFHEGGATNFKVGIQTPVERIQEKIDSSRKVADYLAYLDDAVSVFGRSRVVCTMYIGLGETDDEVLGAVETFCAHGVMPDIKVKKSRDKTRAAIAEKVGGIEDVTPARYESIMRKFKDIMEKNDLDPFQFPTMCYGCRLCTIVPIMEF